MDTLTDLMWESETILVARILLTLFLVLIDASPAIVRMTTGGGAYEQIYRQRSKRHASAEDPGTAHEGWFWTGGLGGGYRSYDLDDPLQPVGVRSSAANEHTDDRGARPNGPVIDLREDLKIGESTRSTNHGGQP
jgi:hypothetical protein